MFSSCSPGIQFPTASTSIITQSFRTLTHSSITWTPTTSPGYPRRTSLPDVGEHCAAEVESKANDLDQNDIVAAGPHGCQPHPLAMAYQLSFQAGPRAAVIRWCVYTADDTAVIQ